MLQEWLPSEQCNLGIPTELLCQFWLKSIFLRALSIHYYNLTINLIFSVVEHRVAPLRYTKCTADRFIASSAWLSGRTYTDEWIVVHHRIVELYLAVVASSDPCIRTYINVYCLIRIVCLDSKYSWDSVEIVICSQICN